MSTLTLADPDDEAKLVIILRSYSARLDKRFHVVFDGGIPGGTSPLSTSRVKVYFASADSNADNILRMMIRNAPNPYDWVVVSSDQMIVGTAQKRKMRVIRAENFARSLDLLDQSIQQALQQADEESTLPKTKSDPRLSKAEVDEWLSIFGDDE